jgi:hypothetical protein
LSLNGGKTMIYDKKVNCAVLPYCIATTDSTYADVFIIQGTTLVATVSVCGAGLGIAYLAKQKEWVYSDFDCSEL